MESFDINTLDNIVEDINSGLSILQITEKYSITHYRYNQIKKKLNIKKPYATELNRNQKKNSFNSILSQFANSIKQEIPLDETTVNMEDFQTACKDGKKITELMEQFKLSLYQVRELKKKLSLRGSDLKTK